MTKISPKQEIQDGHAWSPSIIGIIVVLISMHPYGYEKRRKCEGNDRYGKRENA